MNGVPDCNDGSGTGARARVIGPSPWLVLAACAVATLTGGAGILAILSGSHPQQAVAETPNLLTAMAAGCGECGLIESMRVIENPRGDELPSGVSGTGNGAARLAAPARDPARNAVASTNRYETSIRLHDGSSLVIVDGTPRTWRFGDRVKVIGGAI